MEDGTAFATAAAAPATPVASAALIAVSFALSAVAERSVLDSDEDAGAGEPNCGVGEEYAGGCSS